MIVDFPTSHALDVEWLVALGRRSEATLRRFLLAPECRPKMTAAARAELARREALS